MPASRSKTWRGVGLRAVALGLGQLGERRLVGDRAPQEGGDVVLLDPLQARRHAGLAEILLGEDVGRDLAELRRARRCRRAGRRPSRPDSGSRCASCGIRSPHRRDCPALVKRRSIRMVPCPFCLYIASCEGRVRPCPADAVPHSPPSRGLRHSHSFAWAGPATVNPLRDIDFWPLNSPKKAPRY